MVVLLGWCEWVLRVVFSTGERVAQGDQPMCQLTALKYVVDSVWLRYVTEL